MLYNSHVTDSQDFEKFGKLLESFFFIFVFRSDDIILIFINESTGPLNNVTLGHTRFAKISLKGFEGSTFLSLIDEQYKTFKSKRFHN